MVIHIDDDVVSWLVRHVGWLKRKFKRGKDGKTNHMRLFGKEYNEAILEFGECARFKKTGKIDKAEMRMLDGIWVNFG